MAQKQYEEAVSAYTAALSQNSDSARCLGERGYARLLLGDLDGAEEDSRYATVAEGDDQTHAQVWYNLGLVYQKRGDPERERVAFARSLGLNATAQARAKLGARSACQSIVKTTLGSEESIRSGVVPNWRGVHQFLSAGSFPCLPAAATEQEARARVCIETSGEFDKPDTQHHCDGSPPWEISGCHEYANRDGRGLIVPRENRLFVLDYGMLRTSPALMRCDFTLFVHSHSHHGPVIEITRTSIESTFDVSGVETGSCRTGPIEHRVMLYSLDTGKLLLVVDSLMERPVSVDSSGRSAKIVDQGCGQEIALGPAVPK